MSRSPELVLPVSVPAPERASQASGSVGAPATYAHARVDVEGHETRTLSSGWQVAHAPARTLAGLDADVEGLGPGVEGLGAGVEGLGGLEWMPARVPGTAAGALCDAGLWRLGEPYDFDAQDWWFRTEFDAEPVAAGEEVYLCLDGIATVAEVYLNGELILESDSMFASHALPVGDRLRAASGDDVSGSESGSNGEPASSNERVASNELVICCRALGPLLQESRRPRARWRTRLVAERNLRFFRTMLLGRARGFAPGPAVVGPWRPVRLERRRRVVVHELTLRPRIEGEDGVLSVRARLRSLDGAQLSSVAVELDGPSGAHRAELGLSEPADGGTVAEGELTVPGVARWWPHTHGAPALHDVRLLVGRQAHPDRGSDDSRLDPDRKPAGDAQTQLTVDAGRVGFRELAFGTEPDHDVERDGIDLHINGVRVFARGAVWTPIDPVTMAPTEEELRAALVQAREAGMNMLRLPGTSAYETSAFHDLCDELGILVWQDFMFANFDYPLANDPFRANVTREATEVLSALGGRPSLAVLCGNSEVEQQVAMLGLDPALGRGELFGELLPELVTESGVDAVYVPSAPCGGGLPFWPDRGIANYYGVGSYRRPLEDVRRAGVRFAAECLAFSNVPDRAGVEQILPEAPSSLAVHHPAWKAGVPRDEGMGWDFDDVRDHYLRLLFGVEAAELRRYDHERYLELSRMVTGEVMAGVFGEWRREGSPCGGGMVLWLRDLQPGAGWGVIDYRGVPKLAYHHLKRALAPVAVWTVDEGLGGVVAHVANDAPVPLSASLRVALYRDRETLVEQAVTAVELEPHAQAEWNVATVIGHFVDAAWAYRFGPSAHDAIVVSLERDGGLRAGGDTEAGGEIEAGGETKAGGETEAGGGSESRVELLSQAAHFPTGRPLKRETPERLGLALREVTVNSDGAIELQLSSRRLTYGVSIDAPGYLPSDGGFFIEPGCTRSVTLRPNGTNAPQENARLDAVNLQGRFRLNLEADPR